MLRTKNGTRRSRLVESSARRRRGRSWKPQLDQLEDRRLLSLTINFDSIAASGQSGGVGGSVLSSYLANYGVTLSAVTAGTNVVVYDARDIYSSIQPVVAPSPYNVISQVGSLDPISYTVNFATPQDTFAMTRPYIRSGTTGVALPEWHAYAYDAKGNLISSVGENAFSIFSDLPSKQFTLSGPAIQRVTIASNNHHFAAFGAAILDDFVLSNSFAVTNTRDSGTGSLRQAILNANANGTTTQDSILFNIPKTDPGFANGVFTIKPLTELPPLQATTLDGATQTTFTGDTNPLGPEVVINGSLETAGNGLRLQSNDTVENLVINGFARDPRNGYGIIGTTDAPGANVILNNYIGTDATGITAVPNLNGVVVGPGSSNNRLQGNLISGNANYGIELGDNYNSLYSNNSIGTNRIGLDPIPNGAGGIWIGGSTAHGNQFVQNHIAFNGGDGILDAPDYRYGNNGHYGNSFRQNWMHQNAGLGINLRMPPLGSNQGNEVNPNDLGDFDTGANGLQNYPVIATAVATPTNTTITGTLNSSAKTKFDIELFAASTIDATGYGEGETYLGVVSVTTDVKGNAGFTFTCAGNYVGKIVTSTATDPKGNTSEFSQDVFVKPTDLQANSATTNGLHGLTLNYTIANVATTPFDVGFYSSADGAFSTDDTLLSTITISNPADLTVGSHTKTFTIGGGAGQVALPGMGAGETNLDYQLLAVLDPKNLIREDDADPFAEDNTVALSGAYHPAGGPVYVQGTSQKDTYRLTNSGANLLLATSANGSASTTLSYVASDVTSLHIRSHGGNDLIDGSATSKPIVVFAGAGDDTVLGGSGNDWISGGDGNDLILGNGGNDSLYGEAGNDSLYGGAGNDVLDVGSGANLADGGVGNDTIYGGVNADTITGGSGTDTLVGPDVHNTWVLSGYGAGTLNAGHFTAIENLSGGAAADDFSIRPGGVLSGGIDGKGGVDSLGYELYVAPVMVNLQTGAAPGMSSFLGMERIVGSTLGGTLIGPNTDTTWTITGTNAGTVGAMSFAAFENLVGGGGADTFKFQNGMGVSGVIDGGDGVNTIDDSLYTTPVRVDLSKGQATNTGAITSIQNATGGSANDILVGDEDDNILIGNAGNDTLIGGAGGNDILVGGLGNDSLNASQSGRSILIGGKGADVLVGSSDEDILINGTTSYDGDAVSLASIMTEWKRTDLAYAQRIDHLMGTVAGGLNGTKYLTAATVTDDTDTDSLTGGDGLDWFWAPLSEVIDRVAQERLK